MRNLITGILLASTVFLSYQLWQAHYVHCDDLIRDPQNVLVCEVNIGQMQEDEIPNRYTF